LRSYHRSQKAPPLAAAALSASARDAQKAAILLAISLLAFRKEPPAQSPKALKGRPQFFEDWSLTSRQAIKPKVLSRVPRSPFRASTFQCFITLALAKG
jgi:hypothetical protein